MHSFRRGDENPQQSLMLVLPFKLFPGWLGCGTGGSLNGRKVVGGIEVKGEEIRGSLPRRTPRIIYGAKLDAESYGRDLGVRRALPGKLGQRPPHPLATGDPSERARQIVESMAESLTQELRAKGMTPERLRDQNLPREGWLVQGYFTEVDEGNRLKRAAFGFGRGATSMDLQVAISDLAGSASLRRIRGLRHRKRPEPHSWSIGDDESVCRGGKVRATEKCDGTRRQTNRRRDRRRDREIRAADRVIPNDVLNGQKFCEFGYKVR